MRVNLLRRVHVAVCNCTCRVVLPSIPRQWGHGSFATINGLPAISYRARPSGSPHGLSTWRGSHSSASQRKTAKNAGRASDLPNMQPRPSAHPTTGPVQILRGVVEKTWANRFQPGHNMVRLKDVERIFAGSNMRPVENANYTGNVGASGTSTEQLDRVGQGNFSTSQDGAVVQKHVLCSGSIPNVFVGEAVTVRGHWADDTKHGTWLHLSEPIVLGTLPESIACADMFFRNGGLKGMGPKMYQQLKDLASGDGLYIFEF